MSERGAAAGTANLYDDEQVDLTDQDSQSTVGSKGKGGRPEGDAWDTFTKKPNPFPDKSKRNWIGVCKFCQHNVTSGKLEDLRKHASQCKKATSDARIAAKVQQFKAGGGGTERTAQMVLDSYADKGSSKLNKEQNRVLQCLLTLAFVMCAIPFACVVNPHMRHILTCLKPSFDPPGRPCTD
ncbi:TPA: hypothetical protein ACH3X1_012020 [Trebouxia sp. C0004]